MISEAVYLHYLNCLLEGDKKQCLQIVVNLIDNGVSLKEIYLNLFQRSMYRVGQMWEKERCSIAEEHIATKITQSLIELTTTRFLNGHHNGKLAIITCTDKEFHELGALMVVGFFEVGGWNTLFLGPNTPGKEMFRIIEERKPDLLGISSSFYLNISRLLKLIDDLQAAFPNLEIIVGGQALAEGRSEVLSRISKVKYIANLEELEEYLSAGKEADRKFSGGFPKP